MRFIPPKRNPQYGRKWISVPNFTLKPCPKCESLESVEKIQYFSSEWKRWIYKVRCDECKIETKECYSLKESIDTWNRDEVEYSTV